MTETSLGARKIPGGGCPAGADLEVQFGVCVRLSADYLLADATEPAAIDDGGIVFVAGNACVHTARQLRRPPVLVGNAPRPRRGLLDTQAIEVDAVGDKPERNVVAAPKESGADQVGAGVGGRAD